MNILRCRNAIFGMAVVIFAGACGSYADVTIVRRTKDDNPQLKKQMARMPSQQKAQMESVGINMTSEATIFISGGKTRIAETPWETIINDRDAKQSVVLNSSNHTCIIAPYTEAKPRRETNLAEAVTAVIPTKDTKIIKSSQETVPPLGGRGMASCLPKALCSLFLSGIIITSKFSAMPFVKVWLRN